MGPEKKRSRNKVKALVAVDSIVENKELTTIPASPPPFPPKGMTLEPNGRGLVPLKHDLEYETFLKDLAPLDELRIALAQAGGDKALNFLSDLIRNSKPTTRKNAPSLATLAKRNGLAMDAVAEIWRNYSLAKGITTIASSAPILAADTVEDAKSSQIVCPRCDGDGYVNQRPEPLGAECPICFGAKRITKIITTALGNETPLDLDCPKCNTPIRVQCKQCSGAGLIRKPGDADSRKLIFETMGWTKARQPAVQVNINAAHSVESVLDELDKHLPSISPTYSRS